MSKDKSLKSPARRGFFSRAGRGAVGAAALAMTASAAKAEEKPADDRRTGSYRETDHVRAAYRTARF